MKRAETTKAIGGEALECRADEGTHGKRPCRQAIRDARVECEGVEVGAFALDRYAIRCLRCNETARELRAKATGCPSERDLGADRRARKLADDARRGRGQSEERRVFKGFWR